MHRGSHAAVHCAPAVCHLGREGKTALDIARAAGTGAVLKSLEAAAEKAAAAAEIAAGGGGGGPPAAASGAKWVAALDGEGATYYYDFAASVTSWDLPPGAVLVDAGTGAPV